MTMMQRRTVLAGGMAATITGLALPTIAHAAAGDKKLIFVLQRGAVDALSLIAPVGDPAFESQRGILARHFDGAPRIGSDWAFHPKLANIAGLFRKGECLVHQAVATSYRKRSHFDAQNVLETGGTRPNEFRSGWLNRALPLLPATNTKALALASSIPLALRGSAPVASYAPSGVPEANEDLMRRVSKMYADDDQLHGLWESALSVRDIADDEGLRNLRNAEKAGTLAASLMNGRSGANVLMIELDGWDSHAGQNNQLERMFGNFDAMIGALRKGLGKEWRKTLMIVATEFGRTVKPNPSNGTDHGTASAALLMGGTVRGGRVLGDWPGLADNQLYEGRDLRPTASLEALLAGALADQFGLVPSVTAKAMFPSRSVTPMQDLLRS